MCYEAAFLRKAVDKIAFLHYHKNTIWNGFHIRILGNIWCEIFFKEMWNGFYNISLRAVEMELKGGLLK